MLFPLTVMTETWLPTIMTSLACLIAPSCRWITRSARAANAACTANAARPACPTDATRTTNAAGSPCATNPTCTTRAAWPGRRPHGATRYGDLGTAR